MPSLCQAEWETSSQEKENECQMLEEEEATDEGDGGGEEKADSKTPLDSRRDRLQTE